MQLRQNNFMGIAAGLTSAILFTIMAMFIKIAKTELSIGQILVARALFGMLIIVLFCRREISDLFTKEAGFVWLRSVFGGISVVCYYINIRRSSLSSSTVLTDLSPLFIVLFSVLFFKEYYDKRSSLGVLVALAGTMIFTLPIANNIDSVSTLIGLMSAISSALAYISLKKATMRFSSFTVVFAFSMVLFFIGAVQPGAFSWSSIPQSWFALLIVVFSSVSAQILMTYSYKQLSPSIASGLGLTAIIWALLFDLVLFKVPLTFLGILSIIVIIVGVHISQSGRAPKR